jgi:hypothetical protein
LLSPALNHFATSIMPSLSPSRNTPRATRRKVPEAKGLPLSSTPSVQVKLRRTRCSAAPALQPPSTHWRQRAPRPTPRLDHWLWEKLALGRSQAQPAHTR